MMEVYHKIMLFHFIYSFRSIAYTMNERQAWKYPGISNWNGHLIHPVYKYSCCNYILYIKCLFFDIVLPSYGPCHPNNAVSSMKI